MVRYETYTSQLQLLDGTRRPGEELVLVTLPASPLAPEARKGQMIALLETSRENPRWREACQLVMHTLRKQFAADTTYSATAVLRRALTAANQSLYNQNTGQPPHKRVFVGITCVVVRQSDVYVAQMRPAAAFVRAGGNVRTLPNITSTAASTTTALGASLTIDPELYRATLQPGDCVLLCQQDLATFLDQPGALLARGTAEQICDGAIDLAETHGLNTCVVALTLATMAAPTVAAAPTSARNPLRAAAERMQEAAMDVRRRVDPAMRQASERAAERRTHEQRTAAQLHELPAEPPPMPGVPLPRPLDLGPSLAEQVAEQRTSLLGSVPNRTVEEVQPSFYLGEMPSYSIVAQERRIDLSDTAAQAALGRTRTVHPAAALPPTVGERVMAPLSRAANAMIVANRRRKLRRAPPSAMARSRKRGLSYRRERPSFPWMRLLLLVLIVALAIVYGRSIAQQQQVEVVTGALDQAAEAVNSIRNAPDEAAAQSQVDAAEIAIEQVRATGAITATEQDRVRYEAILREYERSRAAVRRLSYFEDLTEIGQHPQADAGSTFSTIVAPPPPQSITDTQTFSDLYMLDSTQGVLYQVAKAGGTPAPSLSPTDIDQDGLPVGRVRTIAWRLDNVVAIAQTEGGPFTYYFRDNGVWRRSILGGSSDWARTVTERFQLSTYAGNLYVWGALPGQLLKYASGQPGDIYAPWIGDSQHQTDATIGVAIDRDVYLLQPDGMIYVYSGGLFVREMAPPAVKPALITPQTFVVTGLDDADGSIFLVDLQNERIIQTDKQTGALIQQVQAPPDGPFRLDRLTGLAIDESGPRPILYMLNGAQILRATLPNPPAPFEPAPATAAPVPPAPTAAP